MFCLHTFVQFLSVLVELENLIAIALRYTSRGLLGSLSDHSQYLKKASEVEMRAFIGSRGEPGAACSPQSFQEDVSLRHINGAARGQQLR